MLAREHQQAGKAAAHTPHLHLILVLKAYSVLVNSVPTGGSQTPRREDPAHALSPAGCRTLHPAVHSRQQRSSAQHHRSSEGSAALTQCCQGTESRQKATQIDFLLCGFVTHRAVTMTPRPPCDEAPPLQTSIPHTASLPSQHYKVIYVTY